MRQSWVVLAGVVVLSQGCANLFSWWPASRCNNDGDCLNGYACESSLCVKRDAASAGLDAAVVADAGALPDAALDTDAALGMDAAVEMDAGGVMDPDAGVMNPLGVALVDVGYSLSCAINRDAGVSCWGNAEVLTFASPLPAEIQGAEGVVHIAVGDGHLCFITQAHTLHCMGSSYQGETGTGSTNTVPTATQVLVDVDVVDVQAAKHSTCAVTGDGTGYCWGQGDQGQLGLDETAFHDTPQLLPAPAGHGGWKSLVPGYDHTCGITADGRVFCWGTTGEPMGFGDGGTSSLVPVPVASNRAFKLVALGYKHTCAAEDITGDLYCWGVCGGGACGLTNTPYSQDTPAKVPGISFVTVLSAGTDATCAVLEDGQLKCFGSNAAGQLGTGDGRDARLATAVPAPPDTLGWTQVAMGPGQHACGVSSTGSIHCWGDNDDGQLGLGISGRRTQPAAVQGLMEADTFEAVASGLRHTCARTAGNDIWCWGENLVGQLGSGTIAGPRGPVKVTGTHRWRGLAVGASHTCGIDDPTSGTAGVWCWGASGSGALGPVNSPSATPVSVAQDAFQSVYAGYNATCMALADGTTTCVGAGNSAIRTLPGSPLQALGMSMEADNVVAVNTMGGFFRVPINGAPDGGVQVLSPETGWSMPTWWGFHGCAVNGLNLFCWGDNTSGQLGEPADALPMRPLPNLDAGVPLMAATVDRVSAGASHTCAVLHPDKTLACWGDNSAGQLGLGSLVSASSPQVVMVANSGQWTDVAAAWRHTCGILDGKVWCWGSNTHGELGLPTSEGAGALSPQTVPNLP